MFHTVQHNMAPHPSEGGVPKQHGTKWYHEQKVHTSRQVHTAEISDATWVHTVQHGSPPRLRWGHLSATCNMQQGTTEHGPHSKECSTQCNMAPHPSEGGPYATWYQMVPRTKVHTSRQVHTAKIS